MKRCGKKPTLWLVGLVDSAHTPVCHRGIHFSYSERLESLKWIAFIFRLGCFFASQRIGNRCLNSIIWMSSECTHFRFPTLSVLALPCRAFPWETKQLCSSVFMIHSNAMARLFKNLHSSSDAEGAPPFINHISCCCIQQGRSEM